MKHGTSKKYPAESLDLTQRALLTTREDVRWIAQELGLKRRTVSRYAAKFTREVNAGVLRARSDFEEQ
jgi:hypothetical protein